MHVNHIFIMPVKYSMSRLKRVSFETFVNDEVIDVIASTNDQEVHDSNHKPPLS